MSRRTGEAQRPRPGVSAALAMVAIVLIAINLRPGASSVGPVLAELRQGVGMGAGAAGLLTALPGLCFGLVGGLAVGLARRLGMTVAISLGLLAVVGGLVARAATGSSTLFLILTAVALAGMAIGNVLVPAWIKRHSRDGGVRLMTVYGAGLTLGGAVAAALSAPLSGTSSWGWRVALGVWGVVAVGALVPWVVITLREHTDPADHRADAIAGAGRLRHSPTAVALTLLFGVQSMNAYVQFGWLPQIYRDAGLPATYAGLLVSVLTSLGILGGLVMPTVISRSRTLAPWMVSFGLLLLAGYLGLYLAPATVPWLWAGFLGLSGFAFPTAITLITARSRDPRVTARLSGFVQPVGYALAAIGPFVVGLIHEATGGWEAVLLLLMASGVVMTLAGLRVSRHTLVDEELARHRP